jgi:signal transduction histidine kinase
MQLLINDLLTFARVTSQAKPYVEVNLARTAREVVADLEARILDSGGRVEVGDLPRLDADPMQMRQLLQNLLGNALKFHRPDEPPVLQVEGRVLPDGAGATRNDTPAGEVCEITVRDNGIGFDEKYLDRIFAPFQRLHGRGEYEGTGMGLAICRKIVERHGGTITARSAPGRGATFIVLLPRRQRKGGQRHE